MGSAQTQAVDETGDALREADLVEAGRSVRRPAAAGRIPGDHRELVGQLVELALPQPAVDVRTVEEYEAGASSGPAEADAQAGHVDDVNLGHDQKASTASAHSGPSASVSGSARTW